MKVILRVLRGTLQNRKGDRAGADISVNRTRFLIGTSPECHMCCRSDTVSPRHCELLVSDVVTVRDLDSSAGTFVNDVRVSGDIRLVSGDRLRLGRLEFEVLIEDAQPLAHRDPMSDYVSSMLDEADEQDRARRMSDPLSRKFEVRNDDLADETESGPAVGDGQDAETHVAATGGSSSDSEDNNHDALTQSPGKLPQPPEIVAEDTVQAAAETLQRIFDRPKSRK